MIFFDNDLKLTYKSFYKIISEFSNWFLSELFYSITHIIIIMTHN